MAAEFDFAVFGATPMACLVAGLLATEHGRRVCLVGTTASSFRIARRIDLSVMVMTRPETWSLLSQVTPETLRLLASIGKGLTERIDPVFIAETAASIDRLGHMRHLASGFGYVAERLHDRTLVPNGAGCRIRDAQMLLHGKFEQSAEAWLAKAGVRRIGADGVTVTLGKERVEIALGDAGSVVAEVGVLADDAAILDHLAPAERSRLRLELTTTTAIATEPAKQIAAPLMQFLDRGVALHQRAGKTGILALATGNTADAARRIGASIGLTAPIRRVGQAVFRGLRSSDGASLVGTARTSKTMVIAGMGEIGAFLAPSLARFLANAGSAAERAWFTSHENGRATARAKIAESAPTKAEPEPVE